MDNKILKVGDWIYHGGAYSSGYGIIIGIKGEQNQGKTISKNNMVYEEGNKALFDIVYYYGYDRNLHESILKSGEPWSICTDKIPATQEEIDDAIKNADFQIERKKKEEEHNKNEFLNKVESLRKDPEWKHLEQIKDGMDFKEKRNILKKNIRKELKTKWSNIKFSVRERHYTSINIYIPKEHWNQEFERELYKYFQKYCDTGFDAYQDMSIDATKPWNVVFGGMDYIFVSCKYD